MFGNFIKRLSATDPEPLNGPDARLALTALLVRIARSDGHFAPAERARILAIVQDRYGLARAEAEELIGQAEALEAEAPDTVRFTRAIKDAVSYEDRREIVEALWKVVLADGSRADEENALMRMVANLLGISDMDSNSARLRAEK